MKEPLKVLILDDSKEDVNLIKNRVLEFNSKSVFNIAYDEADFNEKLEWLIPDVVISGYNLPNLNYTGLEALLYLKSKLPDVPLIFVTRELNGEELSSQAILKGCHGYLIKDNLHKLPAMIKSVVECNDEKNDLIKANIKKEIEKRIMLEKAIELLKQASDFPTKKSIVDVLEEMKAFENSIL